MAMLTSGLPFNPCELQHEPEATTRMRHGSTEWSAANPEPVVHLDYELDPRFGGRDPSSERKDRFDERFEDFPIYVTFLRRGVLFGREMLVCDEETPTLSSERLYLVSLPRLADKADDYRVLDVPSDIVYLVGCNGCFANHYHWMFQCLPAIVLLRKLAREKETDYRIVLPPLDDRHRKSLALAGVDPCECVTLDHDQYLCGAQLMYTSVVSNLYPFNPSAASIALLDDYRDACLKAGSSDLPRKFYVSRRDAASKRPLVNEGELVAALERHGHEELVLSTLSQADQVCAFAKAESIVAPHGAGLVNLMFSPSSAKVTEIAPEHYRLAYFFRIAQLRGMTYREVMASVVHRNVDNPRHGNKLSVDVERVISSLKLSESSR